MTQPAAGNAILLGLARSLEFGIPDASAALEYYRPILPANADLLRGRSPGGEANQSGFLEAGVPGPVTGPFDFGLRFSAAALLGPLENVLRGVEKTTLATGIFKYVYTPDLEGVDTDYCGIWAKPPVEKSQIFGLKYQGLQMAIGNNTAIPVRLTGQLQHGTRFGAAVADVGNAGTYTVAPVLRGVPKADTGGDLHVSVTQITPSLQFKVERTATSPTYPGAAIAVLYDAVSGRAIHQNVTGATNLDEGVWTENYDPLEIVFPGTATNHANYAVGDEWTFSLSWDLPDATYLAGQRFTSAHQRNYVRKVGASTWEEIRQLTATLGVAWPLSLDSGNGSKYPFGIDRDGVLAPTFGLVRKFSDRRFAGYLERHEAFEMENHFLGEQLSAAYRESVIWKWANVQVNTDARPASNPLAIQETVAMVGETNDDGDAPITIEVITDRDYTLAV